LFNKQSSLLAYFMRAHEEGTYSASASGTNDVLPRDDFPKAELVRCIAVLLSDEFRDDNPLVLNTVYRGRELFNFQPPQGMTIAQERGQLALALSREIQGHERDRRTSRREIMRKLRELSIAQRRQLLLQRIHTEFEQNPQEELTFTRDVACGEDTPINSNNTESGNENTNNINTTTLDNDAPTTEPNDVQLPNNTTETNNVTNDTNTANHDGNAGATTTIDTTINEPNNEPNAEASNNTNVESANETLDPEEFQTLLQTFITLLADESIPDNDRRITAAIVQWYSTLDIELKPEMEVSGERKRLASILLHLGQRIRDQAEETRNSLSGGSGVFTRLWMWAGGGHVTSSRIVTLAAVVTAVIVGFKSKKFWKWGSKS